VSASASGKRASGAGIGDSKLRRVFISASLARRHSCKDKGSYLSSMCFKLSITLGQAFVGDTTYVVTDA
jgi:hypothetical protein